MKIALIHNYYLESGGEDSAFEDEQKLLIDHGHDVLPITFHNQEFEDWSVGARLSRPIWNKASYDHVLKKLNQHRTEIVHIHNTLVVASPSVIHAAKAANTAVVQTVHNFRPLCLNGLLFREGKVCESCLTWHSSLPGVLRGCYRESRVASAGAAAVQAGHSLVGTWRNKVDLYVAPTEFVREKLIQGGFSSDVIAVRPHFVFETNSTSPTPYADRTEGRPSVVFVGRLSPEKGIKTLLDGWKLVLHPDAELVVIGSGPLSQYVESAVLSDKRIVAAGRLPPQEVRRYLETAALVVVPSDCYESFGKVVIEAFAVGTPVIVSGHGGLATIVRRGEEGTHFRPGDAQDLAHQITLLLHEKQLAQRLSDGAKRRFMEQFTAERIYSTTIKLYERAVSASRRHQIDSRVA